MDIDLNSCLRRHARQAPAVSSPEETLEPQRTSRTRLESRERVQLDCEVAAIPPNEERPDDLARSRRILSDPKEGRAKARRRHAAEIKAWENSFVATGLTVQTYREKIQPLLEQVAVPAIMAALRVSQLYAAHIRVGKRVPHPRHWETLANIVRASDEDLTNEFVQPARDADIAI